MFGRATIRLGIGPHSSFVLILCYLYFLVKDACLSWLPYVIGQAIIFLTCGYGRHAYSRCGHYIFALWFLSSIFFIPRLISSVGDWMSTMLPHMWP